MMSAPADAPLTTTVTAAAAVRAALSTCPEAAARVYCPPHASDWIGLTVLLPYTPGRLLRASQPLGVSAAAKTLTWPIYLWQPGPAPGPRLVRMDAADYAAALPLKHLQPPQRQLRFAARHLVALRPPQGVQGEEEITTTTTTTTPTLVLPTWPCLVPPAEDEGPATLDSLWPRLAALLQWRDDMEQGQAGGYDVQTRLALAYAPVVQQPLNRALIGAFVLPRLREGALDVLSDAARKGYVLPVRRPRRDGQKEEKGPWIVRAGTVGSAVASWAAAEARLVACQMAEASLSPADVAAWLHAAIVAYRAQFLNVDSAEDAPCDWTDVFGQQVDDWFLGHDDAQGVLLGPRLLLWLGHWPGTRLPARTLGQRVVPWAYAQAVRAVLGRFLYRAPAQPSEANEHAALLWDMGRYAAEHWWVPPKARALLPQDMVTQRHALAHVDWVQPPPPASGTRPEDAQLLRLIGTSTTKKRVFDAFYQGHHGSYQGDGWRCPGDQDARRVRYARLHEALQPSLDRLLGLPLAACMRQLLDKGRATHHLLDKERWVVSTWCVSMYPPALPGGLAQERSVADAWVALALDVPVGTQTDHARDLRSAILSEFGKRRDAAGKTDPTKQWAARGCHWIVAHSPAARGAGAAACPYVAQQGQELKACQADCAEACGGGRVFHPLDVPLRALQW